MYQQLDPEMLSFLYTLESRFLNHPGDQSTANEITQAIVTFSKARWSNALTAVDSMQQKAMDNFTNIAKLTGGPEDAHAIGNRATEAFVLQVAVGMRQHQSNAARMNHDDIMLLVPYLVNVVLSSPRRVEHHMMLATGHHHNRARTTLSLTGSTAHGPTFFRG